MANDELETLWEEVVVAWCDVSQCLVLYNWVMWCRMGKGVICLSLTLINQFTQWTPRLMSSAQGPGQFLCTKLRAFTISSFNGRFLVFVINRHGVTAPCSSLKVNRRFGGTSRLYHQDRINRGRDQPESRWQTEYSAGRKCKEWTSVAIGSPVGQNETTTERTNRRQGHEFMMALKRAGFAGVGKRQEEKHNRVLGREPTCKREVESQVYSGRGNSVISQKIILLITNQILHRYCYP
jgi:hypothetical protein